MKAPWGIHPDQLLLCAYVFGSEPGKLGRRDLGRMFLGAGVSRETHRSDLGETLRSPSLIFLRFTYSWKRLFSFKGHPLQALHSPGVVALHLEGTFFFSLSTPRLFS